jgi:hypothetical protein
MRAFTSANPSKRHDRGPCFEGPSRGDRWRAFVFQGASEAEDPPRSASASLHQLPAWNSRVYRWEFDKGTKSLSVAVNGPLIVDDVELVIRGAIEGIGLSCRTGLWNRRSRAESLSAY